MLRISVAVLCGVCVACAVFAQEGPISTIENEGVATIDSVPNYVEFWLHVHANGGSVAEAVGKALNSSPRCARKSRRRSWRRRNWSSAVLRCRTS